MNETWSALVDCWGGSTLAPRVVFKFTSRTKMRRRTSSFAERCRVLQSINLVRSTSAAQKIEVHTLNLIDTRRSSCSLLAFCGSPELSLSLHQHKISNDMLTVITGNKRHQMEYVSESYGGVKKSKPRQPPQPKMKANDSSRSKSASIMGRQLRTKRIVLKSQRLMTRTGWMLFAFL
jgi:hypothetical protein